MRFIAKNNFVVKYYH